MALARRLLRLLPLRPLRLCGLLAGVAFAAQLYLALKFVSLEESVNSVNSPNLGNSVNSVNSAVSSLAAEVASAPDNSSLREDELDFSPPCRLRAKEAVSAVRRARSPACKRKIVDASCAAQDGELYAERLPSSCPNDEAAERSSLGCYRDEKNRRLLPGYYANHKETNRPQLCIDACLQGGFPYAGVQYSTECFCGENPPSSASKIADSSCNMKCPGNPRHLCGGYFTMNIYSTGISKFTAQTAVITTDAPVAPVRIVFLLTLNGRALRQVRRLINVLYDPRHYFYIHVDARQDYLFRELRVLEKDFSNIKLTRKRFATIWGGASLLEMLLASMKDLLTFDWKWDFVINLSESDFPVKSVEKLEEFLSANRGKNFVKSHGREVQRFIQKQGLDKTFVECDAHMWRVGDRKLPWGIQIDGGSDWIALDRRFVSYVVSPEDDELLTGLLVVFKHTLLPAESFFHTVLRNSKFCNTYIDNNLHVTNWKRKLGCKCQYKHVVDWCGCSPNDFRLEDWPRLQATEQRQLFFARKFEPIVNQAIILRVEQWIQSAEPEQMVNVDAYWQNIYHSADNSPLPDDGLITAANSIARHNAKMLQDDNCIIKPIRVNEVTSYHFADTYKGGLILHEARINTFGTVILETWFKYQHFFQVSRSSKLFDRLRILAVSSDFDQKEQIFRNLVRSLGPFSEPTLMYHFIPSLDESTSVTNVTFIWFDPAGNIADVNDLSIYEGSVLNFVKPNLKVPLLPGVWIVRLLEGKSVVAVTKFLITPLQFMSGSEISEQEAKTAHIGSVSGYKDFTSHENVLSVFLLSQKEKSAAQSKSFTNSIRFGPELNEWIDSLILQFYSVLGTCIASNDVKKLQCGKVTLMPCHTTAWSSLAPDPKSFEGNVKNYLGRHYVNNEKLS